MPVDTNSLRYISRRSIKNFCLAVSEQRQTYFRRIIVGPIVSGPTPNKALFKELVSPPGDFSLVVPVCSLVI